VKKITRSGLKSVVKECLIEILSEGISSEGVSALSESRTRRYEGSQSQTKSFGKRSRRPSLDNISFDSNREQQSQKSNEFDQRVSSTVSSMTNDAVLSSLLEDTARTTLQEQIHAEGQRGPSHAQGDSASRTAASSDPMDLFGSAAGNWAELAFSKPKNRP